MTRPDYWKDCTIECERRVKCAVCGRTKPPRGRSVSPYMASGYCEHECSGHDIPPEAGHLWPGELADMDREPEEEP